MLKFNLIVCNVNPPEGRAMPREIRRRLNSFKAAYTELRQFHYLALTKAMPLPRFYPDLLVRVDRLREAVPRELVERAEASIDRMFPSVAAESNTEVA